jgi:hypothetical protein
VAVPWLIYLGPIKVSDEAWIFRSISHSVSGPEDIFRDKVRARDGRCVISGVVNATAEWGSWAGYEVAHVFPLQHENLWIELDHGCRITNKDSAAQSSINSVQNGILMFRHLHTLFDQYLFSIDPDVSKHLI